MGHWKCPKHGLKLETIEDYPGALLCPAGPSRCPTIFTIIDGHLCRHEPGEGDVWRDVKTGEEVKQ